MHPSRLLPVFFCVCSLLAGPETSLKLVWSDEFNEKEIDKKKWNFGDGVRIVDGQAMPAFKASGDITSMSQADGYIEIPAQTEIAEKGEIVDVKLF